MLDATGFVILAGFEFETRQAIRGIRKNVTLWRVLATIFAVEKQ